MFVHFVPWKKEDLTQDGLVAINDQLRSLVDAVNELQGMNGPTPMPNGIDMQGAKIENVGAATATTDALSQSAADSLYGASAQKKNMEATGTEMLQTVRRLNDRDQQEQYSTFLNTTLSTPPGANGSHITAVDNGGSPGSVTYTVSSDAHKLADGTAIPYTQRVDTFTKGTGVYYYYLRLSDKTLQITGPYSVDTPSNRLDANLDGRVYVATAKLPAASGAGTGTSGAGGDDISNRGCCEVGTRLTFPPDSDVSMDVEKCSLFHEIRLQNGQQVAVAPGTMVSVFVRAESILRGMHVETANGRWEAVKEVIQAERHSAKMVVRVVPGGCYYANGIRVHNAKTN